MARDPMTYFPSIPGVAALTPFGEEVREAGIQRGREWEQAWAEPIRAQAAKLPRNTDDAWSFAGTAIGEGVAYMGAALAGGYTAGPVGAAMVGLTVEGDNAYKSAKAAGATEEQAQTERMIVGSINAAIEALQIGRLMKFGKTGSHSLKNFIRLARQKAFAGMARAGGRFGADILKIGIEEALEEFAQEGVSITAPAILRGDYPTNPDGSPDWWAMGEQLGMAALAGAVAGPVLGGGISVVGARGAWAPNQAEVTRAKEKIEASNLSPTEKGSLLRSLQNLTSEETISLEGEQMDVMSGMDPEVRATLDAAHKVEADLNEMEAWRPIQKEEMAKERARRFAEYEAILKDVADPVVADSLARQALKGQLLQEFTPLQDKGYTEDDIARLHDSIRQSSLNTGNKLHLFDAINSMFVDGKLPEPKQIKLFDKFFGTNIAEIANKRNRTKWKTFVEAMNTPRALLASLDFSAAGRQGALLLPMSPKIWAKSLGVGYRAFANEKYAAALDLEMKTNPYFQLFTDAGGYLTDFGNTASHEEPFISNFGEKLGWVRASERAYTSTLNSLRFYNFARIAESWEGTGKKFNDYQKLAQFINHATGRGDLKWLEKYGNEMNALFFSPRLQMGRIQAVSDLFTKGGPVRKIIAADLLAFIAMGLSIMGLFYVLSDYNKEISVEYDPRSTDFGKCKLGNTRLDFWAGYSQIARFVTQLIMGQRKSLAGELTPLDYQETVLAFLRTKLSPPAGVAVDAWTGETYLGDKVSLRPEFIEGYTWEHVAPLFVQDCIDAITYQGIDGFALTAPLAVHGVGAMTYEESPHQTTVKTRNHYAQEVFGKNWDELGPTTQKLLRVNRPQIMYQEAEEKAQRDDYDFVGKILQKQHDTGIRIQEGLAKPIQSELNRLQVGVGGLSQTINQNWRLNETRYKQYEEDTRKYLNRILAKAIASPIYDRMSDDMKKELLEEMINRTKQGVRQQITNQATISDLESMKAQRENGRTR
jgi:hypothetical protein